MLQRKLRHPTRKLRIHSADAVVLDREVRARERTVSITSSMSAVGKPGSWEAASARGRRAPFVRFSRAAIGPTPDPDAYEGSLLGWYTTATQNLLIRLRVPLPTTPNQGLGIGETRETSPSLSTIESIAALPDRADVVTMLRIAEALRDHFKGLLKANQLSWTGHRAP